MELPTGRRGQVVALAMTGIVLAMIWFAIVNPLRAWYSERAELLAERQALAANLEQRAVDLPALLRRTDRESASELHASTLLEGATDALAGAHLLERLQQMAASSGAVLTNVAMTPPAPMGELRRIGAGAAVTATWPQLLMLLREIDLSSPRLLVAAVEIRATPFMTRESEPPLEIELSVFGFRASQKLHQRAAAR